MMIEEKKKSDDEIIKEAGEFREKHNELNKVYKNLLKRQADADIRPCEDDNDDFKEQIANMSGMAIIMLEEFMKDCRKMAQENWCPSQVEMLDRLFKAVSLDEKYDEV